LSGDEKIGVSEAVAILKDSSREMRETDFEGWGWGHPALTLIRSWMP
jgi:hypothetical protein